jgi:hypothetical protein
MADQASVLHPHRLKMDGSSDSICLNCLGTIAAQRDDQPNVDAIHICPPAFSSRRSSNLQPSA